MTAPLACEKPPTGIYHFDRKGTLDVSILPDSNEGRIIP
jgi:hypothetical protein